MDLVDDLQHRDRGGRARHRLRLALSGASAVAVLLGAIADDAGADRYRRVRQFPTGIGAGLGNNGGQPRTTNNRSYCRFFQVGPVTPDAPEGEVGEEVHQLGLVPDGTLLWRGCYYRSTHAVSVPLHLWETGTNPYDALALERVDVEPPTLGSSPAVATLPNVDTYLWAANAEEPFSQLTLAGETVAIGMIVQGVKFRIVPHDDPALASVDDDRVVVCGAAITAYEHTAAAASTHACKHRFAGPARTLTIETTTTYQRWAILNGTFSLEGTTDVVSQSQLRIGSGTTRIRSARWLNWGER